MGRRPEETLRRELRVWIVAAVIIALVLVLAG